jgi:phenylpropionate dioxygenase-like ring-hydroxylating dioxygenase large terminal subunit
MDTTMQDKYFSWSQQWYPVAIESDLDPTKPNVIQLLNKNFIVWKDLSGPKESWRATEEVIQTFKLLNSQNQT